LSSDGVSPVSKCSWVLVEGHEHCDGRRCVFAVQDNVGITQREGVSWSYTVEPACVGSMSKIGPASGTGGKYRKVLGFRYPGNIDE